MTQKTVLVIGAGGAGLTAAIAAAQGGACVYVVSKTAPGQNTSTLFSGGIFSLAGNGVTPEKHFQRTLKVGAEANDRNLLAVFCTEAAPTLEWLARLGIDIKYFGPGRASVIQSAVHKLTGGEGFLSQLEEIARAVGVHFINYTCATHLGTDDHGITGTELTDWRTNQTSFFPAGAVVLATGGAGQIFRRTDNPARVTGDGYALAAELGVPLIDMEFTQFYPLGWDDPKLPIWMGGLGLIDFLPLTDADGKEFLLNLLHQWGFADGKEGNLFARDRSAVAIARAAANGGAFLHFENAHEDLWKDKDFIRTLIANKKLFRDLHRPVNVAPLEHYFCGGVKIDTECRTNVPGLFACGEVTGGVDGANRMGGNALSNIATFGRRAGANAAETARNTTAEPCSIPSPSFDEYGEAPAIVRRELQNSMWENIGPLRTAVSIGRAQKFLSAAASRGLKIESPHDRLLALEMPGLLTAAAAVARGALARTESLGVHYRADARGQ